MSLLIYRLFKANARDTDIRYGFKGTCNDELWHINTSAIRLFYTIFVHRLVKLKKCM